MAKTADQMVQNWQQRMGQAGPAWAAAIQNTQKNPMLAAIAQQSKMVNNWNNSVNSGVWANRLSNTTVQYWKQQCAQAAQKFAMGAQKGLAKYRRFATAAQPVYAAMRQAADNAQGPIAKVQAALQVLLDAGRKQGGNAFA